MTHNPQMILGYIREGRNYIIVLIVLLAASFLGAKHFVSPVGSDTTPVTVVVPKGAGAAEVGIILAHKGLIRSSLGFALVARASGDASNIKPGAYRFSRSMPLREILDKMVRGDLAAVWVTVPEGFTVRQIAQRLADRGLASRDAFLSLAQTGARSFSSILDIPADGLEGYLFPNTYLVPLDADPREVLRQMLETFQSEVVKPLAGELPHVPTEDGPRVDADTLYRTIIVASMIEREAKLPEDRPLISAVIQNRLRQGMKLEVDATVDYALGDHRPRLYYEDLTVDSPYNTYLYPGLPPGPISNPGLASIKAALHPAEVDYLYYVARPDGSHVFSRTLEEHNAAKARIKHQTREPG